MDPTPVNRLVHHLMLQDKSLDIAYLAQPCQYFMNSNCTRNVWTFGRYSQKVVKSMNYVVTLMKEQGIYHTLELIGYSGGGAIALLLAAQRDDVVSVRTVAGNLSPHFLNRLHGVSEMHQTLDPVLYNERLSTIPQIHFVGNNEKVVPADVSQHYLRSLSTNHCGKVWKVQADHQAGWIEQWPLLLERQLKCVQ